MNKKTKKEKNKVMESVKNSVGKIFEASENAKDLSYKCIGTGREYSERPGAYLGAMTRAMAHDMMSLALFLHSVNGELAETMKTIAEMVRERDIELRRIFDDLKDHRPIAKFPYDKTESIVEMMTTIKRADIWDNPMTSRYKDVLNIWMEKITKMDIWAYYCECRDKIEAAHNEADMRAFDEDGEQVFGIPEKDAKCVKIMLALEEILLQALVRIPFDCKESQECMDKIEVLNVLTRSIINGDNEKIEYLAKCAEAAKEFKEFEEDEFPDFLQ